MRYKGVKGWLLLLCISMTILDPGAILFNLILVTDVIRPLFEQYPAFLRLLLINGACGIGLAVFSIYAGISLWKALPHAVPVAKRYLMSVFAYSIISIYLPRLVGIPEGLSESTSKNTLFNSLTVMMYTTLWYLYLKYSRRVRATFGMAQGRNS